MPDVPKKPISTAPAFNSLLATDKVVVVRTPQNEADPALRVGLAPRSVVQAWAAATMTQVITAANLQLLATDDAIRSAPFTYVVTDAGSGNGTLIVRGLPATGSANSQLEPTGVYIDPTTGVPSEVAYDLATDTVTPFRTNYLRSGSSTGDGNLIIGPPTNGNDITGPGAGYCTMNGGSGSTINESINSSLVDAQDSAMDGSTNCAMYAVNDCHMSGSGACFIANSQGVTLTNCGGVTVLGTNTLVLTGVNDATYINGVEHINTAYLNPATAPATTVIAGTFTNGELQGTQPAGSLPGQKFTTATYGYEYQKGAAGSLVWCRYPKG